LQTKILKEIIQLTKENKVHDYSIRGWLLFTDINDNIRLVVPKAMWS